MAVPERLLLTHEDHLNHRGGVDHRLEQRRLAGLLQPIFELEEAIEMVLDRLLAPAGDDAHLLDTAGYRLLHDVLDHRLIHHRQHLFGHRLGGGQEPLPRPAAGITAFRTFRAICPPLLIAPLGAPSLGLGPARISPGRRSGYCRTIALNAAAPSHIMGASAPTQAGSSTLAPPDGIGGGVAVRLSLSTSDRAEGVRCPIPARPLRANPARDRTRRPARRRVAAAGTGSRRGCSRPR